MALLLREIEGPLRTWLRAQSDIGALTDSGRFVYFDTPPDWTDKPDQWLTLRRIGGAPQNGETPLDDALITFGCYGRTRLLASNLAETLVSALRTTTYPVAMGSTVSVLATQTILWAFQPDDTTDPATPRMVVDIAILFRALP